MFRKVRSAVRFAPTIVDTAREFITSSFGGGKFIAVHWRHGDIFNMDPAGELKRHGSRTLMKRVRKAMDTNHPGELSSVSGVFLLTNCHYEPELRAVAKEAKRHLGVKLVRYMNPSDWVLATAVDLAIASQSDYLYFTHCGSFFTTFIEQERDMDENGVYQPGHHQNPPECLEVVVPEQ